MSEKESEIAKEFASVNIGFDKNGLLRGAMFVIERGKTLSYERDGWKAKSSIQSSLHNITFKNIQDSNVGGGGNSPDLLTSYNEIISSIKTTGVITADIGKTRIENATFEGVLELLKKSAVLDGVDLDLPEPKADVTHGAMPTIAKLSPNTLIY
jgi:hypothetical protein